MELFFCHKNVEIKSIIPSLAEYIENWFGENKMRKTLSPKLDVVFQALFGEVGRVGIPFNDEGISIGKIEQITGLTEEEIKPF